MLLLLLLLLELWPFLLLVPLLLLKYLLWPLLLFLRLLLLLFCSCGYCFCSCLCNFCCCCRWCCCCCCSCGCYYFGCGGVVAVAVVVFVAATFWKRKSVIPTENLCSIKLLGPRISFWLWSQLFCLKQEQRFSPLFVQATFGMQELWVFVCAVENAQAAITQFCVIKFFL